MKELVLNGVNLSKRYERFKKVREDGWNYLHRDDSCDEYDYSCPFKNLPEKSSRYVSGCLEKIAYIFNEIGKPITEDVCRTIKSINNGTTSKMCCSDRKCIDNLYKLVIKYYGGLDFEAMEIE